MNARVIGIVVAILVLAGGGYFYMQLRSVQQAAVKWEGPIDEIASETITKDRDIATIQLTSRIDAPVDVVFDSFTHPEKTQGLVDEIKVAKIVAEGPNKKTVEFHATTLGQMQILTVDLTYFPQEKKIGIKSVEGVVDIDGAYVLTPSPDGKKTLVSYSATQKNKLPLPVPEAVEKSAIKEQFANLMRAIKKDLQGQGKLGALGRDAIAVSRLAA